MTICSISMLCDSLPLMTAQISSHLFSPHLMNSAKQSNLHLCVLSQSVDLSVCLPTTDLWSPGAELTRRLLRLLLQPPASAVPVGGKTVEKKQRTKTAYCHLNCFTNPTLRFNIFFPPSMLCKFVVRSQPICLPLL